MNYHDYYIELWDYNNRKESPQNEEPDIEPLSEPTQRLTYLNGKYYEGDIISVLSEKKGG